MQQVLLVMIGMRRGAAIGQPVVGADECGEQFAAVFEDCGLVAAGALDETREIADELPEARGIFLGSWCGKMNETLYTSMSCWRAVCAGD